MQIIVNAHPREVSGPDLAAVLSELGYTSPSVASAVNGVFVPRDHRGSCLLSPGDRVEILAPMQGG